MHLLGQGSVHRHAGVDSPLRNHEFLVGLRHQLHSLLEPVCKLRDGKKLTLFLIYIKTFSRNVDYLDFTFNYTRLLSSTLGIWSSGTNPSAF